MSNEKEVKEILEAHKKWLRGQGGQRANLYRADLYRADLYEANLYRANLYRANLRGADLYRADLRRADLRGADLYEANLYRADLRGADLYRADLRRANLRGADLEFCKGIMSFTGEKHLLIYFKFNGIYYFKIGCITKTCDEWLEEFESIGEGHKYGANTQLYGDVIKLFSRYDLEGK